MNKKTLPRASKTRPVTTIDQGKLFKKEGKNSSDSKDSKSISFVNESEEYIDSYPPKSIEETQIERSQEFNENERIEERVEADSDGKNSDDGSEYDGDGDILNEEKWDTDIEEGDGEFLFCFF